jgi:cytochrome c oxidase subunit 1
MLWAVAMVAEFLLGGVTGIVNGSAAADIYVHDSYFVVAHFHYTLVPIALFAPFAGFYFWFPKLAGKMLGGWLAVLHFAGTVIFFNLTFLPQFSLGMMGMHRRIANPQVFEYLQDGQPLQVVATVGAIGLVLSQVPFLVNLIWTLARGRAAERNPWRATTLDWQTASPPPHGNFEGEVVVSRGPYVYSPPGSGEDFVPQDAPGADQTPDHPARLPVSVPAAAE